jgi:hypothetical protein
MQPYDRCMFCRWFEEGIDDGGVFRRRFRWALAVQWLLQLVAVALILLTN